MCSQTNISFISALFSLHQKLFVLYVSLRNLLYLLCVILCMCAVFRFFHISPWIICDTHGGNIVTPKFFHSLVSCRCATTQNNGCHQQLHRLQNVRENSTHMDTVCTVANSAVHFSSYPFISIALRRISVYKHYTHTYTHKHIKSISYGYQKFISTVLILNMSYSTPTFLISP